MKKMRKSFFCVLTAIIALILASVLSGCGAQANGQEPRYTEDGRVILRVSMYNSSSYPLWRAYVEKNCPHVLIQWENNRNAAANLLYLAKHGDLPDIVAIRRFESDTTAALRPYLSDLHSLALTERYEPQYLEPFSYQDRQYWLPGPGVVDGMVANTELLKEYGLALPTNLNEFLTVCSQLEKHQITSFAADAKEPWSPTQLLEGFGASLFSGERGDWVRQFEEGKATSVEEGGFVELAQKLRLLSERGILTTEDLEASAADTNDLALSGKAAIVRKNSDEKFDASAVCRYAMLPFFGETQEDSRLCTYPVFSLAISKRMEESDKIRKSGEEVLTVMLSQEAQEILAKGGEGLISYQKDMELPLSAAMQNVKDLIEEDKFFIRALNSNSFSANALALAAIVRDHAGDQEFLDILNANLFQKKEEETLASSSVEARNRPDEERCVPSASVVAQVLQKQTGADCALIDAYEAPTTIYRGAYTQADIEAVVLPGKVYEGTLTPKQLLELLNLCIFASTTFSSGQIEPILEYPAVAGMTIQMQPDGTVVGLNFFSKKSGRSDHHRIVISARIYEALLSQSSPMSARFTPTERNLREYLTDGFRELGNFPAPEHYFVLQ